MKREQLAFSNCMHVLQSSIQHHHVGATLPRLYSPHLQIVKRLKCFTAKTVPAVLAVLALKSNNHDNSPAQTST